MNSKDLSETPVYGNPLDLDHLSVDKMNFHDIIEQYEGDFRIIKFPQKPIEHHPV